MAAPPSNIQERIGKPFGVEEREDKRERKQKCNILIKDNNL
jgi:hypothetical protein